MDHRPIAPSASLGIAAVVVASVLWGTTGIAAAQFPDAVSRVAVGAVTMGFGGALLFLTAPRMSARVLRHPPTRVWALAGAVGVVAYPLAFYPAMDLAGIAVGNVVALGAGPVFTGLIERIALGHHLTRRWAACTALAVVGVALLGAGGQQAGASGGGSAPLGPVIGIALGVVAGAGYAVYTVCASRVIALGGSSRGAIGAVFGVGAAPLLIVLAASGGARLAAADSIGAAVYLVIGPMFIAYLFFGSGLRAVRASTATTISLLQPVVAAALAVGVVGERLDPLGWCGMIAVVAALVLLAAARRPRGEPAPPLDSRA